MKLTISVTRVCPTAPFETCRVEVTEEYTVREDEVDLEEFRTEKYSAVTKSVNRFINNELKKYAKDKS